MKKRERCLETFIHEHARLFQEPIIQGFLAEDNHWDLLKATIEENDRGASEQLDKRFEVYYLRVRMMQYINKLTRFYVNTYDQSKRQQQSMLIVDQPIDTFGEERATRGDFLLAREPSMDDAMAQEIRELLPTEEMGQTFQSFHPTRKTVLHYYTFDHLNDHEISEKLNCTPQNVSKTRRKALAQLRGG
ncbi:DNA-directed RNA polymerase specialized sigma subunit [Geomicrobium halophilum]|uniref:DNA-directed RNA polymerase specialized sigma subunit n=1 Tax=Geomicrobium halophilum TaxID=549000 RepID=A0A841PLT0_9BACL|nr:hypothetical protein [Geomicrobium halophilum]MBB6449709.1 DNA-directed RNA polymerase specialized sigma subunit [Geomicrobium halophilum]